MTANAYVRARIDQALKDDATAVLDSLGLTVSDVMRMMLTRIAREKALPIELTQPNAETLAAIEEARAIAAARCNRFGTAQALFDALDGNKR
ncbi:antitoxin of YafQ-DinJ toxin-antitoxin system [Agrobacterium tumefaciens str. CFBP 5621]|uniref:type II toxin-antitoxin system RelB/DinJ family antitoxin n=1 Tax=Agrobacterium tumefaciens TaxID=358 RepID=UPI0009BAC405|nr:type II toxin-antitoxin system RelB/DinJ family antitoxin [Agrobacterium tumefaciens]CUX27047.1 antitoxin of YafQ-DinJ toxin-antitoxin system [Agrobacterium tumefaciens str. CFBP 5621]